MQVHPATQRLVLRNRAVALRQSAIIMEKKQLQARDFALQQKVIDRRAEDLGRKQRALNSPLTAQKMQRGISIHV